MPLDPGFRRDDGQASGRTPASAALQRREQAELVVFRQHRLGACRGRQDGAVEHDEVLVVRRQAELGQIDGARQSLTELLALGNWVPMLFWIDLWSIGVRKSTN